MQSQSPEVTFKDRSIQEIHLERGCSYVIGHNLKNFSTVVNVLAKFSEQILLQPAADSLVLSASNSAKSAYAKITLSPNFFDRLQTHNENLPPEGELYCRIATKSLLHIFKNIGSHSCGHVPSCSLELDPQGDYAYVHLQNPYDIRHCHVLSLREHAAVCENVFLEKQRLKNRVTAHSRALCSLFSALDCRELELAAMPDHFSARRHVLREDYGKVRRTEINIPIDHFETYHIHVPTRIVINLRELRPILHFADSCGMAITLHFDRPGRPLIISVEENVEFVAEFVLATLDDPGVGQNPSQPPLRASTSLRQRSQQQPQQINGIVADPPNPNITDPRDSIIADPPNPIVADPLDDEFGQNPSQPLQLQASTSLHQRSHSRSVATLSQQQPQQINAIVADPLNPIVASPLATLDDPGFGQNLSQPPQASTSAHQRSQSVAALSQQQPQQIHTIAADTPNQIIADPLNSIIAEAPNTIVADPPIRQSLGQSIVSQEIVPSQGQLMTRPAPAIELVDSNEVPLEHYMSQDQQNVVVPRPEGMSFWEQSEVGSSVLSARSRLSRLAPEFKRS